MSPHLQILTIFSPLKKLGSLPHPLYLFFFLHPSPLEDCPIDVTDYVKVTLDYWCFACNRVTAGSQFTAELIPSFDFFFNIISVVGCFVVDILYFEGTLMSIRWFSYLITIIGIYIISLLG